MLKYWGEDKGRKYMESLSRQGLQFRNGHALLADLMSVGEFPVAVVIYPDQIEQMKLKGQPVEWVKTTDPILVNLAPVSVAAKGAASKRGQAAHELRYFEGGPGDLAKGPARFGEARCHASRSRYGPNKT